MLVYSVSYNTYRKECVAMSKTAEELMIRGTVVKVRRKCGKARCKCTDGALHETWALSVSFKGRTRMIALREEDLPIARGAIKRYQKALGRLETQAMAGIRLLHSAVKAAKRRKR